MAKYLLAYDIAEPRRLAKIQRFLSKRALQVQYSLYLVELDPRAMPALWDSLLQLIHPKMDDLRCYPLASRGFYWSKGRGQLPTGLFFSGML